MYTRTFIEFIRTHRLENANDTMVSMSDWTITHVNGLVSPTHRGRNRGERGTPTPTMVHAALSIRARDMRQHVVFAVYGISIRFENS
jgi:hypothetical protein